MFIITHAVVLLAAIAVLMLAISQGAHFTIDKESHKGMFEMSSLSTELTTEHAPKNTETPDIKYGDIGRLYVSNINVALYEGLEQEICDTIDSACYKMHKGVIIIADHSHQGFDAIKDCRPGDVCVVRYEDGTADVYECTVYEPNGKNLKNDLADSNGTSIFDSGADMIMYTCNEDWENVTIAYWNVVPRPADNCTNNDMDDNILSDNTGN